MSLQTIPLSRVLSPPLSGIPTETVPMDIDPPLQTVGHKSKGATSEPVNLSVSDLQGRAGPKCPGLGSAW